MSHTKDGRALCSSYTGEITCQPIRRAHREPGKSGRLDPIGIETGNRGRCDFRAG